jgi:aryl carrier-like protein
VSEHVARVIGAVTAQAIDPKQPLSELGLDSLMAVELRNRLGTALALKRSLPATLVFDHPTLEALAQYFDKEILPPSQTAAQPAAKTLDDMSDEEVERLYAKKMRKK